MDYEQILAAAERALASQSVTEAQINADLARVTGGQIKSLSELRGAVASQATPAAPASPYDNPTVVRPKDLARSALHGASLGWSPEIAGFVSNLVNPGSGKRVREGIEGNLERFQQERPGYALASELAGGLATAAIPAGTAMQGGGLLRSMGQGLALGAGTGAVAGAGYAEPGERLQGAKVGTAVGGALGVLTPVVARAVAFLGSKGVQLVEAAMNPNRAAAREAGARLAKALKDSGLSVKEVQTVLADIERARPGQAVPADVSRVFGAEARRSVQEAPEISQVARDFLESRQSGAGDRLASGLAQEAGVPEGADIVAARSTAREARRKVAKEAYGPLESMYAQLDDDAAAEFRQLFEDSEELQRQWAKIRPSKETAIVREEGAITDIEGLDFKNLQTLAQRLDDDASAAFRAGRGNEGNALRSVWQQLTDVMEETMPGYRAANRQYAQSTATLKAFDNGAKALTKPAAQIAEDITKLGENAEAVKAYRFGMVDALGRKLRGMRLGSDVARGIADAGPEIEARLRAAFPDQDSFERFLTQHAQTERRFAQTRELVLGGGTRQQPRNNVGIAAEMLEQGMRFSPGAAAARGVRGVREMLVGDVGTRAAAQTGRKLLTPGQTNLAQFVKELEEAQRRGRLSTRLRAGFERGAPVMGGLLAPSAASSGYAR